MSALCLCTGVQCVDEGGEAEKIRKLKRKGKDERKERTATRDFPNAES